MALLADCRHGYSVHESTLWLSLLRGAIDPDPVADRGQHHFTYSLWRPASADVGRLPTRLSLASVADPGVIVETAKWAEDEDALIVRLYEAQGGSTSVSLDLRMTAADVDQVDLLERNPRALELAQNGSVALDFRAHEIKTIMARRPTSNL